MNIFWVLRFCEYYFLFFFFLLFFFFFGGGGGGGVITILDYIGAISMHFRVYLRSMYRMGNIFLVAKI